MKVSLKKVRFSDIEFLWYLRNQPDVYQYIFTPKPVSWEEHVNWIIPIILSLAPKTLYVITFDKIPVGQLRFDYNQDAAKISISLLKEFRGKGIASKALKEAITIIRKERRIKTLIAEIHKKNNVSTALFERLGFIYQKKSGNYLIYHLAI